MFSRLFDDAYGLLQVMYGKNRSVDNREKNFDMSKIHGSSRVCARCDELLTDVDE
jgi:hypothetical protein